MKKILLTSIIALVTVVGAIAQTTSNVAVTATVQDALTLTPTAVAFGAIQAGQVSYIQANGNDATTQTNLGVGATAGSLQIQGTTGADVTVSWANGVLTDASDTNPITFTPAVYGASQVTSGTDVTITGGDITLGVGGSLAAIANAGAYSTANAGGATPVVFTVQYASI